MPDWSELVRQRLAGLELDAAERGEVHAELAAHLEECYEIFCKRGLPESEAARRTLGQVSDWQELRRKISAAKRRRHPMKKRLQQLWVPGFLTFILFVLFLMTLQKTGFRPRIIGNGPNAILFYGPWLGTLPFIGALGAYLSSRAGGSRRTVLLSSVFPVLALTTAFLLMFPIDLIVKWIMRIEISFRIVATTILRAEIGLLLVPGAALLVGGLLVQLFLGRRSTQQKMTIG